MNSKPCNYPDLLTAMQVAEILNCPERWVRRAIHERRIETVKVGHYVRIPRNAVEDFIHVNTRPSGSAS